MRSNYQQIPQQGFIQQLQPVDLPVGQGYGSGFTGFLTSPEVSQGLISAGQAILNSGYGGNIGAAMGGFNEGFQNTHQKRIDNAQKRALLGRNNLPASLQLANAYQQALDEGDVDKANQIALFSKVYDKGVVTDNYGNASVIPGYANSVATIGATKKGAEQNAKNSSDLKFAYPTKKAEAEGSVAGKGEITDQDKKALGQAQVDSVIDELNNSYNTLDKQGAAINPKKSSFSNIGARIGSSYIGQGIGNAVGTEEQSTRNQIKSQIPIVINSIRQATGMSAKAMDSNAELQFYLKMASDPTVDIQTNLKALNTIKTLYGTKQGVNQTRINPTLNNSSIPQKNNFQSGAFVSPGGVKFKKL